MSSELRARLRTARKAAGYSQDEAGEVLGVSRAAVSKYEIGAVGSPTVAQVERFAAAYGVEPAWLAFGVAPMRRYGPRGEE